MTPDNDGTLNVPPINLNEEKKMPDVPASIHEQSLARLAQASTQAHENFVQFSKVLDLSYEQGRKLVSQVEAMGVREVTSKSGQQGIPIAGGQA